jgi:hypothetical protein
MQTRRHEPSEQLMPGRMKLDLIAPIAEAVERQQARRIAVGSVAQCQRIGTAQALTESTEFLMRARGALAPAGIHQSWVRAEEVVIEQLVAAAQRCG